MIFLNMKRRLFEKSSDVFSSCATLSKCQKNLILPTKLEPKWFLSIVSAQNFSVMSWCIPQKFLPTNLITKRILHLSCFEVYEDSMMRHDRSFCRQFWNKKRINHLSCFKLMLIWCSDITEVFANVETQKIQPNVLKLFSVRRR